MNTLPLAVQKALVACDFAQIEARVIAWLAGQRDILDVFACGEDVYAYTAQLIGSKDRQLGKVCVLGLGFGMGASKFILTAASYGLTIDALFAENTVKAWRKANHRIVGFWWDLDRAFRSAIAAAPGATFPAGAHVRVVRGKAAVLILLPSGRHLVYRNAQMVGDEIVYDGVDQTTKQWGPIRTYGGKLAENVTQAVARDVMAETLLRLDASSIDLRLTVHDEIIAVAPEQSAQAVLATMLATMRKPPEWAPGLPVGAEGWIGPRYRK